MTTIPLQEDDNVRQCDWCGENIQENWREDYCSDACKEEAQECDKDVDWEEGDK